MAAGGRRGSISAAAQASGRRRRSRTESSTAASCSTGRRTGDAPRPILKTATLLQDGDGFVAGAAAAALLPRPPPKSGLDRQDSLQAMMSNLDELATGRAVARARQSHRSRLGHTDSLQMMELNLEALAAPSTMPSRSVVSPRRRVHFSSHVEVMEFEVLEDEQNDYNGENEEGSPRNSLLELGAGLAQEAFETRRPSAIPNDPRNRDSLLQLQHALAADAIGGRPVRRGPRDSLMHLGHTLDAHAKLPMSGSRNSLMQLGQALDIHAPAAPPPTHRAPTLTTVQLGTRTLLRPSSTGSLSSNGSLSNIMAHLNAAVGVEPSAESQ